MKNKLTLIAIIFIVFCGQLNAGNPYVLLVSLDGFRWDYTSRNLTPHLDSIANSGVSALSLKPIFPSSTFPNHLSIITGLYAENHGIIANWFKDQFSGEEYSMRDSNAVTDPKWYLGEAFWTTAKRNGIKTASYFWPGSELRDENRRPDIFMKYQHEKPYKDRIDGVIEWLKMPASERPHFITLYFHETDSKGHQFGPDSPEMDTAIALVDSLIGYLADEINKLAIADSINIIILSDHGMAGLSPERKVNMNELIDCDGCMVQNYGAYMTILPPRKQIEKVFGKLKLNSQHYDVYPKGRIPAGMHYSNNPFIWNILVSAHTGWSLVYSDKDSYMDKLKGGHGFSNEDIDMHGILIASGQQFKSGFKTGTLNIIDIYPLLCNLFRIKVPNNIDGELERINFLLSN